MTECSVTILIPTYARSVLLQEALWCALNQTVSVQIIVLNDCPRQNLVCNHPLVTMVNLSERISSLGEKRNELLRLADTEWVIWLDDDDWLLPWYVEDVLKIISENLDAVFTGRCWFAMGGSGNGVVHWKHGGIIQPMAVRVQAANACGGFPVDMDYGEDIAFRASLIAQGRVCSLAKVSGYCYRWDNGMHHISGSGESLAGRGHVRDAESRLNQGIEPSGRIVITPSLLHDYFAHFPDSAAVGEIQSLWPQGVERLMEKTLFFADRTIQVSYPAVVESVIDSIFKDFRNGEDHLVAHKIMVEQTSATGKISLHSPGMRIKEGLTLNDFAQQFILYLNSILLKNFSAGLVIHAGAVEKANTAIVVPGGPGVGKSMLTAWFISRSFNYLTDNLVCIYGENNEVLGLPLPIAVKKSAVHHIEQLLSSEQQSREDIIQGETVNLIPWRHFSSNDKVAPEVPTKLLVFPEFRETAELSIEALPSAQAALLLMAHVVNGPDLPGHGFSHVSRICRDIPALRLVYSDYKQLTGVLDRLTAIITDSDLTPADLIALTSPFNRQRQIDKLGVATRLADATRSTENSGREKKAISTFPIPQASPRGKKKKLTIGMATYDDYDGVYFTVQALRLYHPEILEKIEIIVIDNHPDGPCAAALCKLDTIIPGYRYVPELELKGTSVRDLIFREACGTFVLCIDCHVMIMPGVLQKLIDYLDAHPKCNDLLQGPLVKDDLLEISTHFNPVWQKGMFGVWHTDKRGKDSTAPPFDIPMQGMGLFCCRKDAWPGFNPRFRGFGGEEGYIHEKFRQQGGRSLCLPFLRWLHRFERPMGIPYRNNWEDRIYNYFIGFNELGLDTRVVEDHFNELLGQEVSERIFDSIRKEMFSPFFFFDAIYCINLDTDSERWQKMLPRLLELGIFERIRSIKISDTLENKGHVRACTHREIIAKAQRRQFKNVLIFENMAALLDESLGHLGGSIKEIAQQDWQILHLGAHDGEESSVVIDECSFLKSSEVKICSAAVAYNSTMYADLLKELPESADDMVGWSKQFESIDQYLSTFEKRFIAVLAFDDAQLP